MKTKTLRSEHPVENWFTWNAN